MRWASGSVRMVSSKSHRTPDVDRVKSVLGIADEINVGSIGLKLALIAGGERDLYVNPSNRTSLWDTCGPEAILHEAGGRLTDLDGAALPDDVALFVARLCIFVVDPLIGWLSDTVTLPGLRARRRPWIFLGALFCLIAVWQLLLPNDPPPLWQFTLWATLAYIGIEFIEVPHSAWTPDLAKSYDQRSLLNTFRTGGIILGTLFAFILIGAFPTVDQSIAALGFGLVIGIPLCVSLGLALTPDSQPDALHSNTLKQSWTTALQNGPFWRLALAYGLNALANVLPPTLLLTFVRYNLGLEDSAVGLILFTYFVAAMVGTPLWFWVSKRIGKHRAWCIALLSACPIFAFAPALPAGEAGLYLFLVISFLTGLTLGADLTLPQAIQADVVDLDELRAGRCRAGSFYAYWSMTTALAVATGGLIGPLLITSFGFVENAPVQTQQTLWAIAGGYAVLPIVLKIIAISLSWRFPITALKQAQIQRILAARKNRSSQTHAL